MENVVRPTAEILPAARLLERSGRETKNGGLDRSIADIVQLGRACSTLRKDGQKASPKEGPEVGSTLAVPLRPSRGKRQGQARLYEKKNRF